MIHTVCVVHHLKNYLIKQADLNATLYTLSYMLINFSRPKCEIKMRIRCFIGCLQHTPTCDLCDINYVKYKALIKNLLLV